MSFFFCCKHLIFISFIFSLLINNQLIEAQLMEIDPNLDQSLLPFGSIANSGGGFIKSCGIPRGNRPTFTVLNNCPYTVWAAAVPGGGRRLDNGDVWTLKLRNFDSSGRVWGRTNCNFDNSGRGKCQTGDCGGVLNCQGSGAPPVTLAEFALSQFNNMDFLDISLVDGFNIPTKFSPKTSYGCSRGASCTADINQQCPKELRAPGGCNNPCTVFKTNAYCCFDSTTTCGATNYSRFFKSLCPDAYSYPLDDPSTLTCPGGTSYDIVFCPS
ncbi:protein P21-like [Benincasa hispida]|uniref:protein P21-like n=1 Tax=Benincasa hispida TaxID=102211 RepID=UPI001900C43E|nr:protein P21-like [Benincasa hispida]